MAGRADGLFVETLGIELSAFDAGDFRRDQRGTVLEVLRAICGPTLELSVVGDQRLYMCCCVGQWLMRKPRSGERERAIEVVLHSFKHCDGDVHSNRCADR